jgi:sugar-specific transcriptional regulator TrmB
MYNMEVERELREIGLKSNEIRVYLTLLRIGGSKAGRIAQEAGLERTSAYAAIKRLVRKGLVSYSIADNKRVFAAADPGAFLSYF